MRNGWASRSIFLEDTKLRPSIVVRGFLSFFPSWQSAPIGGRFLLCLSGVAVGVVLPYVAVLRLQHGDHPTGQALIFVKETKHGLLYERLRREGQG